MTGGVAMPEWLTRQDRQDADSWRVQEGSVVRGDSWTNLTDHTMRAPIGHGDAHRVIRAREMMRARVSPASHQQAAANGITEGSLRAAEEFRVNTLVKALEFDTDALADGSERITGERLAEVKDHASLVHFTAMTAGTKGCASFLRGVKNVDENLSKNLREIEKALVKKFTKEARRGRQAYAASLWGDTTPYPNNRNGYEGLPRGYVDVTTDIAALLDNAIQALQDPERDAEEGEEDGENGNDEKAGSADLIKDLMTGKAGRFAPLNFGHLPLTKTVRGSLGRKRTATNVGRNPRRLNRALTDPQRRIFDRTRRNIGGVVIIDQSGSMDLSASEVEEMMQASPGCTIIGYSHGGGRAGRSESNIWIMARDGRRCETVPEGNGGNGVDGPALRYAVEQARRGEPVVWVCDGLVTSQDDQVFQNLDDDCARLVRRHKVHMIATVPEGVKVLQGIAKGDRPGTKYVGNVRRAAIRLGFTTH